MNRASQFMFFQGGWAVSGGRAPGLFNYNRNRLSNLRGAIARVLAGTGRAKIAFPGDSTTAGNYADAGGTFNGLRSAAYPAKLKLLFRAAGIPAQDDSVWGNAAASAYSTYDPRVTIGAGWAPAGGNPTAGGFSWANSSTTNALSFVPELPTNTFDVWYLAYSGFTNFTIGNGTQSKTVTQAGGIPGTVQKATITIADGVPATPANYTWSIAKTGISGSTYILGFEAYDANSPMLALWNMGWQSSKSQDWNVISTPEKPLNMLVALAPDHTHFNLLINNYALDGSTTQYDTDIRALFTAMQAVGGCSAQLGAPSASSATALATQASFASVLRAAMVAKNMAGADLVARWVSYVQGDAKGFYAVAASVHNTVHPSALGHQDNAVLLKALFK